MIADIFSALGLLAIVAGGLLAAFTARRPSRLLMWLVAYLVLVGGLVQFGLAAGWQHLGLTGSWLHWLAFIIYNLGNAGVITGRALKGRSRLSLNITNLGGALLAVSMLLLLWSVRHAAVSWVLIWFLVLVLVILVSMPIGLAMSARRRADGVPKSRLPNRT